MTEHDERLPLLGPCTCRPGVWRDNCSQCEGTGKAIDWKAFHSKKQPAPRDITPPQFSAEDLALILEALDSHEYWQLSDTHERNDGYSLVEDGENEDIDACRALVRRIEALSGGGSEGGA